VVIRSLLTFGRGYFDTCTHFTYCGEGGAVARISRICVCALALALGFGVSGCSSALRLTGLGGFDGEPVVANPVVGSAVGSNAVGSNPGGSNPIASNPSVAAPPKMQAGDHINVTVYNEASLSGNYSIDSGGFVTIPRAGRLRAAGLTASELADLLVKKFRSEYLNNPKVTVALI
jgi:Polysaccharide biosynthesis/export protein